VSDAEAEAEVQAAPSDAAGDDPAPTATKVLRFLVGELVDEPESVVIDQVDRRRGLLLEVRVAQGDMGRVIGRRGRTAQSIRTVVRAAATRDGVEVDVDFVD
jgi:uncharacterized protein